MRRREACVPRGEHLVAALRRSLRAALQLALRRDGPVRSASNANVDRKGCAVGRTFCSKCLARDRCRCPSKGFETHEAPEHIRSSEPAKATEQTGVIHATFATHMFSSSLRLVELGPGQLTVAVHEGRERKRVRVALVAARLQQSHDAPRQRRTLAPRRLFRVFGSALARRKGSEGLGNMLVVVIQIHSTLLRCEGLERRRPRARVRCWVFA